MVLQIAVLARDSSQNSVVDKVFKHSLKEFHTFLISTYSLSLQARAPVHSSGQGETASSGFNESVFEITSTCGEAIFSLGKLLASEASPQCVWISYCPACPYVVYMCVIYRHICAVRYNAGVHGRFYGLDLKYIKRKWSSWKTSHGGR